MPGVEFYTATSFIDKHQHQITAVVTVVLAIVLAEIVDRTLARRGRKVQETFSLSPVADTRLRLVRRLVFATILVLGVGFALIQFPSVKRVATGVLASSAVLGLVIGFAARQTLANGIAGVLLAITQPIRIGDLVTFEEQTGEVEDIRLTYTYVRCLDGRRLIVPNERLAQSSIQNHTIVDPGLEIEVSVWVKEGKDALRALDLLAQDEGVQARVAEIDKEGVRLAVTTWADSPRNRGKVATRLREDSLRRLAGEGLS